MYKLKGATDWTEYPGSHSLTHTPDFASCLPIHKRKLLQSGAFAGADHAPYSPYLNCFISS